MMTNDEFIKNLVTTEFVNMNVAQNVVVTTEDKLKLAIQNHSNGIGKKKDWIAPFSIALSIIVSMSSTEFRDFIVSKEVWSAVFLICFAGSIAWFFVVIRYAFGKYSTDALLEEIKTGRSSILDVEQSQANG